MKYPARVGLLFGGRASIPEWEDLFNKTDILYSELTGSKFLENEDPLAYHIWKKTDFNIMKSEDSELEISLGATFFDPCIAIPYDSYGYSINMFIRGSKETVKKSLEKTIDALGFPSYTDIPSHIPQLGKIFGLDPNEIANVKGWNIFNDIIRKHGAELKKLRYNICRFPYNLLIRQCDGKVVDSNGKILGDQFAEEKMYKYVK